MDSVKLTLGDVMNHGYKARDGVVMDADGTPSASLYRTGATPDRTGRGPRPTTSGLMATNCLKFGAYILGDPWYARKYDELVRQYRYRESRETLRSEQGSGAREGRMLLTDWDDTEHVMGSLWLVSQLERDPDLKDFYKLAATALFETKKDHNRSFFNYMYAGITGDRAGANLGGALETLQLYPSVTYFYPVMNSIRTDLQFTAGPEGDQITTRVMPFNEIAMDNSSDWKCNPYNMDGWLARGINAFAVSAEDSMVWFIADQGGTLYRSLDGGASFAVHDFSQGASVNDVVFAGGKSRIVVLATNRGIFWSHTGGYENRWRNVQIGGERNVVRRLMNDPQNANVVWAVADDGVWRSVDLGQEEVGKAWTKVSGSMPDSTDVLFRGLVYGIAPGPTPSLWAILDGRIYRKNPGDGDWASSPLDIEGYHRIPDPKQIVVSPRDPNTVFALFNVTSWGNPSSMLLRSTDGGKTFGLVGSNYGGSSFPSVGSGLERQALSNLVIDPNDPRFMYASSPKGIFRSTDGGTTWQVSNSGLRIPFVTAVYAPKQIPGAVFASTPAGFVVSRDRGATWDRPLVVLNGRGVNRTDRGGYGYLVAYWAGRYFECVSDAEAASAPNTWTTSR